MTAPIIKTAQQIPQPRPRLAAYSRVQPHDERLQDYFSFN
ncbi:hypothetical protein COO91_01160 [Nostoc flagelliforme CCNUN1]|uniref:Uncharacterized protein n=1 Tax=Nostoc flagelliforme CCNUN1 TaxID=2038116 RepID=A0A2K8SII9_9NOSO|nr:hypothetical protein COO91_01160 [Nostoc flagelliforme CCNUN1]